MFTVEHLKLNVMFYHIFIKSGDNITEFCLMGEAIKFYKSGMTVVRGHSFYTGEDCTNIFKSHSVN